MDFRLSSYGNSLSPDDALLVIRRQQQSDPLSRFTPSSSPSSSASYVGLNAKAFYPRLRPSRQSSLSSTNSVNSNYSQASAMSARTALTSPFASARSSLTSSFDLRRRKACESGKATVGLRNMPKAVLDCILVQLGVVHGVYGRDCYNEAMSRDLRALAVVNKQCSEAALEAIYRRICLATPDPPELLKKYRIKHNLRLKFLRRTLASHPEVARCVRHLHIPAPSRVSSSTEYSLTMELITTLVKACPNLETLAGIPTIYKHRSTQFVQSLSSRPNLTEILWRIGEEPSITARSHKQLPPGLMSPEQVSTFLSVHAGWENLDTLALHALPGGILEHGVMIELFFNLPSLARLSVSNFDHDDFNDSTIPQLGPLTSLRLSSLPGVTSSGLSRLANTQTTTLTTLSLLDLNITSLLTVSKLFSHLPLRRFTISQPVAPTLPTREVIIPPLLASSTLQHIHWDIPCPSEASFHLSASISLGFPFPRLEFLCAPEDNGSLQHVCAPVYRVLQSRDRKLSSSAPDGKKPTHEPLSVVGKKRLRAARARAQGRIETAKRSVGMTVMVTEDEACKEVYEFGGFVGAVGSRVRYTLGDENAIIGVEEVGRECHPTISALF